MRCVKGKVVAEDGRIETPSFHGVGRIIYARGRDERGIGIDQLLIVEIEEQLVLEDWPTDRAAKVVVTLPPLFAGSIEVVSRIQVVILEVIVARAVKLIGTALANDVEDIAAATVLRRGGRSNHGHFGHVLPLALV